MYSHAGFQDDIMMLCRSASLHVHSCGMLASQAGFPDLVIIGPNGVLWRELKIPPDGLTGAQRALGYTLQASGQDWAVWIPRDRDSGRIRREIGEITR